MAETYNAEDQDLIFIDKTKSCVPDVESTESTPRDASFKDEEVATSSLVDLNGSEDPSNPMVW